MRLRQNQKFQDKHFFILYSSAGNLKPMEMYNFYDILIEQLDLQTDADPLTFSTNTAMTIRTVYLRNAEKEPRRVKYVIYTSNSASMCVLFDDISDALIDDLECIINPELYKIATEIFDQLTKGVGTNTKSSSVGARPTISKAIVKNENTPKYLFIDEKTLRHYTNIEIDPTQVGSARALYLPRNVANLITDFYNEPCEATEELNEYEEYMLKSTDDFWILKRQCNSRQYYVIIFNKKATLLDVTKDAEELFDREIRDDVFFGP